MKAKTSELLAALAGVMPLQKTRTTLPMLNCLKLEAKDGLLQLTATDLDAFAAARCPCEGDLPAACVDAAMFDYLVHKATGEVEFSTTENKRLVVKGEGLSHLGIQDAAQFPPWPNEKGKVLKISTTDLAECIHAVEWAPETGVKITQDIWRECVWVKSGDKEIECCGTDSKEFAYIKRSCQAAPAQFMIPSKLARFLVNALQTTDSTLVISDNWLSTISAKSYQVAVRLVAGKYIPISYLLDQALRLLGVLPLAAIIDSLHTVKALGKDAPYISVRFEFEPAALTILFRSEAANFERIIPHQIDGEAFAIALDGHKAISVLSHVDVSARASLAAQSLVFHQGESTIALALMKT